MNRRDRPAPLGFDEQRVLEDLQNLHREIQRVRGERERAEAEFDRFLRGFHEGESKPPAKPAPQREAIRDVPPEPPPEPVRERPPAPTRAPGPVRPAPPPAPPPPAPPVSAAAARPAAPAQPSPPASAGPTSTGATAAPPPDPPPPSARTPPIPPLATAPPPSDQAAAGVSPADAAVVAPSAGGVEPPRPLVAGPRRRTMSATAVAIPVLAVALVAALFVAQRQQTTPSSPDVVPAAAVDTPAEPAAAGSPAGQEPAPDAAPPAPARSPSGVNLEIVTVRPVWLRVTVDGRRALERELPAGERIPVQAERTILIRAGDAGALTLTQDGRDLGPLGADGIVATREFKAPESR